ncbi:hypothetical protein [Paenibacillus cremeus]|nr:hypothetical protein [Paenibacillus cremeus]
MLMSVSHFQHNIALILEAKALEASRSSQWLCHHLSAAQFGQNHGEQVKRSVEIHDHVLDVIDGLTKMEQALAKNMQALLGEPEAPDSGSLGDMLPLGGN